jgi:hypothetical protein
MVDAFERAGTLFAPPLKLLAERLATGARTVSVFYRTTIDFSIAGRTGCDWFKGLAAFDVHKGQRRAAFRP